MINIVEAMNQMKGGIIINSNIASHIPTHLINFESCFYYFIKNSKWEYIEGSNLSASGVIFKCTLLEGIDSPFINIRLGNIGNPVKEVIIKFVILHNERGNYAYYYNENNIIKKKQKKYENSERFFNEIQIQNELTRDDLLFLDPLCPFLIYSDVISESKWPSFYSNFFNEETQLELLENVELFENYHAFKNRNEEIEISRKLNEGETQLSIIYLSQLIEHCLKKNLSLSFIGMEMLDDSYSLYNHLTNIKNKKDENLFKLKANIVIYESIQMAIKGFVHGDLHLQNVFLKEKYNPYFKQIDIKVIIIDYGYANKINSSKKTKIIQTWNEICDIPEENIKVPLFDEKMRKLLDLVFNSPRIDGGVVVFDWVNKLFIPEYIYKIHKQRISCIEETIVPLLNNINYNEDEIDASVYHFTRTGGRVIKENQSAMSFLSASSPSLSSSSFKVINPSKKSKTLKTKNSHKLSKKNKSADSYNYYQNFSSKKSYKNDVSFEEALKQLQLQCKNVKGSIKSYYQDISSKENIKNINNQISEYFTTLYKNNEELENKLAYMKSKKFLSSKSAKTQKIYVKPKKDNYSGL